MLRKIIPLFFALFACQHAGAQGKQIQYLIQQIAELQVYIGYLKKGYNIVQTGIHTIRDIRKGEFNLHSIYYSSLKNVNPRIRHSAQATGIVVNHQYVIKSVAVLKKNIMDNNAVSDAQRKFILQCCERLAADADKTSQSLLDVISSGKFEMSDDERINRVNELYKKSIAQSVFIQQLLSETTTLLHSLMQDEQGQQILKSLYNIK